MRFKDPLFVSAVHRPNRFNISILKYKYFNIKDNIKSRLINHIGYTLFLLYSQSDALMGC